MRITGYIFLLTGFLLLGVWFASAAVPLPRSIFVEMDEKYPPTRMYSHTEVLDAVGSVMTNFKDNSIRVIVPAGLMLLGGILLDVSGRRSGRRNLKKESGEPSRRDS
jgi:hypothetical protein